VVNVLFLNKNYGDGLRLIIIGCYREGPIIGLMGLFYARSIGREVWLSALYLWGDSLWRERLMFSGSVLALGFSKDCFW
jgi:hypothetical protein